MKAMDERKVVRWQVLMDRVEEDLLQAQTALAKIAEKRNKLSEEAAKLNRMKAEYLEDFHRRAAEPQLKTKTVFIKDFVQHLDETLISIAKEIEQVDKVRTDSKARCAALFAQFSKYRALNSRAAIAVKKQQRSRENKEQDMQNVLRYTEKST